MNVGSLVRDIFSIEFQKSIPDLTSETQLGNHFISCISKTLDLYVLQEANIKICSGDKRQCLKTMFYREIMTYLNFIIIHDYEIASKRIFKEKVNVIKQENKVIVDELLTVDCNNGTFSLSATEGYKIYESKKEYEIIKACIANLGLIKVLNYCRINNV